ncbi:MAG: hypothetical protein CMH28_02915 [Micavibrio sp.]|nr:hypothetical protein [Micavibrio sp.]
MKSNLSYMALQTLEGKGGPSALTLSLFKTPYGTMIGALHGEQLCYLAFIEKGKEAEAVERIQKVYPDAKISKAVSKSNDHVEQINAMMKGEDTGYIIPVLLKGTEFYLRAWQALARTQPSETLTYRDLATKAGNTRAARSIGQAMSKNPLAYLIPCHRVLPSDGGVGNYAWGVDVKEKLLRDEGAEL